jgi:hypothetical protein
MYGATIKKEMTSVYSAVRTGALNKAVCASSVKSEFRSS